MTTTPAQWAQRFWIDLQPTPGRLGATFRILLASILTLIFLLVWHIPFASIGLYFVFIVGRDNPSVSLRTGVISMITLVASVAVELGVVAFSDNDPMARVLGVAVVSFIAGSFSVASNVPTLPSTWGFIFCTLIATWERHASEDALVKGSLWILAATGIAVACSIAVEYVFGSRHPAELLIEERRMRYQAMVKMFNLYAQGAPRERLEEAVSRVGRLAAAGQSGMQRLYNSIVDRNLDAGTLPIGARVRITMLAELTDVAAAFGYQFEKASDPAVQKRCAQIALECQSLLLDKELEHDAYVPPGPEESFTLLDRVEGNLHVIASMPHDFSPERDKELVALPSHKVSLLIPGALKDPATWAFGMKISLCATLCYILYFSVDWPGISTSVTTVLITGLSTTGAIKQKFVFRLTGALIGGLILGIGCTAFLFPEIDSITALVILVGLIAFASAWIAGGRQFGYVGLQIAFAYYLVTFEDFHSPTALAPARDRLIGILLALVVMWFVFDNMWPVRTVTAMRRSLASILRNEAQLFRAELSTKAHEEVIQETDAFRDHIGKTMAAIRSMNDAVEFEFGVDRLRHMQTARQILRSALVAVALVWNEITVLHEEEDPEFLSEKYLRQLRQDLSNRLDDLATVVLQKTAVSLAALPGYENEELRQHPRYGEYVRNTIARLEELQTMILGLEKMP